MNLRILLGIVLIIAGLLAAAGTFGALDRSEEVSTGAVVGDENQPARSQAASIALPILAGIAIAAGGTLIAFGMARFRNPRVVSPNERRGVDAPGSPPTSR